MHIVASFIVLTLLLIGTQCNGDEELLRALKKRFNDSKAESFAKLLIENGLNRATVVPLSLLQQLGVGTTHERLGILQAVRECNQSDESIEELPERLIFSVNTGRSGSRYLASVLDSCQSVLAEHEPRPGPGGSRNMMYESWESKFEERRTLKCSAIRKSMKSLRANTKRATIYAETNPNFKVWIWDVVIDEFGKLQKKRMDIMIIRKYIPALVKSIYELGWFQPPHASRGENWLPTANGVNSLITSLAADNQLDAYDRIISSIINTEAVAQHMMDRFGSPDSPDYLPNVHFHEYRSEELFDGKRALEVLRKDLKLLTTDRTEELVGVKIDKYRQGKDHNGELRNSAHIMPTDLHTCELRVKQYLQKCKEHGIQLPELPHLQKYPGFTY